MHWIDAYNHCKSKGGKLVEIDSKEENAALVEKMDERSYMDKKISFWIGFTDMGSEGDWRLASNGLKPLYENWHSGQPNNYGGNEVCAMIWKTSGNWTWTDIQCKTKKGFGSLSMHALCEFSPPKERPTTEGASEGNHTKMPEKACLTKLNWSRKSSITSEAQIVETLQSADYHVQTFFVATIEQKMRKLLW